MSTSVRSPSPKSWYAIEAPSIVLAQRVWGVVMTQDDPPSGGGYQGPVGCGRLAPEPPPDQVRHLPAPLAPYVQHREVPALHRPVVRLPGGVGGAGRRASLPGLVSV